MPPTSTDYARGVYLIDGHPMTILECYNYKGRRFWRGRWREEGKYRFRYFGQKAPRQFEGAQLLPGYRFPDRRTLPSER
jgi:hypothetical protein